MSVTLADLPAITADELELITNPLFAVQVGVEGSRVWRRLEFEAFYNYLVNRCAFRTGTGVPGESDKVEDCPGLCLNTSNGKIYYHDGVLANSWVFLQSVDWATLPEAANGTINKVIGADTFNNMKRSISPPTTLSSYQTDTDAQSAGRFYWSNADSVLRVVPANSSLAPYLRPGSQIKIRDTVALTDIFSGTVAHAESWGSNGGYQITFEGGYTKGTFTSGNAATWTVQGALIGWNALAGALASTLVSASGQKVPSEYAVVSGMRDHSYASSGASGQSYVDGVLFQYGSMTGISTGTTDTVTEVVTFPETFSTVRGAVGSVRTDSGLWTSHLRSMTNSSATFRLRRMNNNPTLAFHWMAWGDY